MSRREPRVVAELGRPETPEETAARKAQNSRNHRDRQTTRNLLLALLATVGVVALLVLLVPRGDAPVRADVDYGQVAEQAQGGVEQRLVVPALPDGWSANVAELRQGADGVNSWYIGFVTPSNEFFGLSQGFDANESWASNELEGIRPTGTDEIGGREWQVYDHRDEDDRGNREYALTTEADDSWYVLYGTGDDAEAATLAAAVAAQIEEVP